MKDYQSLSHTKWDCKYHVVFIPKRRKKRIFGGYLKGKSAIQIARKYGGRSRNFSGENFWARGYFVSTVGLEEAMVRAYIRSQEVEDERYEQMKLIE